MARLLWSCWLVWRWWSKERVNAELSDGEWAVLVGASRPTGNPNSHLLRHYRGNKGCFG
jgi:hypothetical protein